MERFKEKKILITGSKGLLGSSLKKILTSHYSIIAVDRKTFDITDKDAVKSFLSKQNYDVIIHCAAYTDVDRAQLEKRLAFKVNVDGTKNIIENIKNKNSLFVYISTDYVFSGKKKNPYTETDKPCPINIYGKTKLCAEKLVSKLNRYIIIRTSWLFGPNGENFVNTIFNLAKEKKVIEVVSDQVGSPTYSIDLSKAIDKLLTLYFENKLPFGIYHITNSGITSWFEFAKFIVKAANFKTRVLPISSEKLKREAKRPKNSSLSNEKFYALSNFYLPSWQEAVKHYINNYLIKTNNGYIKK